MQCSQIKIVLVNTSHPGNIGAAARALKTMGLSQLVLVAPRQFPHPKAIELAVGADDILTQAQIYASLALAIADCSLVIGASSRARELSLPVLNPRECALTIAQEAACHPVAIVFGNERSGLTNEELQLCHQQVIIPTNPDYPALNLAAAVQVIAYELQMLTPQIAQSTSLASTQYATSAALEEFYAHLEHVLVKIRFLNPDNPKRLMPRLHRLFNRIRLEQDEVNLLRGILAKIDKALIQSKF